MRRGGSREKKSYFYQLFVTDGKPDMASPENQNAALNFLLNNLINKINYRLSKELSRGMK